MLRMRDPVASISRQFWVIGGWVPIRPARSDMQAKDKIVNATLSLGESPWVRCVPSCLSYRLNAPRVLIDRDLSVESGPETGTAVIATMRGARTHVVMDIGFV